MNIFGVGLIFGPKKLPELGKQLGKTLKSLKKASNEFQNQIDQAMNDDEKENLTKSIEINSKKEINQENQELEKEDLSNKENNNK